MPLVSNRKCCCRFLFPGMPDDGAVIPDPPGSPSKVQNSSSMEDLRWACSYTARVPPCLSQWQEILSLLATLQCCGGELLLPAPPSAPASALPSSLHAVPAAGGAGRRPVLGPHPASEQTTRSVAAQLPGSARVSVHAGRWSGRVRSLSWSLKLVH